MFVTQYFVGKSCPCESESVVHSDYLRLFRILAIVDPGVTRFRILLDTFFGWALQAFKQPVSPYSRSETLEDVW